MSMRIKSGCSPRASLNAVSASTALSTLCPALCKSSDVNFMFAGLSSTTNILAI